MAGEFQRLVILNRLFSSSTTRVKDKDAVPVHTAFELLKLLKQRVDANTAVEFFGADSEEDDAKRLVDGKGKSHIKIRGLEFSNDSSGRYASALIEFLNKDERSMPVVSMETHTGRELEGDEDERGAYAAHVVVRMPLDNEYDDSSYRLVLEVNNISRKSIEHLLCRQLRRIAGEAPAWTFPVWKQLKTKKKQEERRYHPKFELAADVGRTLDVAIGRGGTLSQVVFTKRHEKQSTAGPTAVLQSEFFANVTIRVAASEGPTDPDEKVGWFGKIRQHYLALGYEARTYFRHAQGGLVSGEMSDDVANAADIMMCQKEYILLSSEPKRWRGDLNSEVIDRMKTLLNNDGLWQHAQQS